MKAWIAILIFSLAVSAKPAEDLDYEEESDKEMDEENARIPLLLSKEQELFGKTGANVSLPCEVDDIGSYVRLWRRELPDGNAAGLFIGTVKNVRDSRFGLLSNGALTIEDLTPEDAGQYICSLSTRSPAKLVHNLVVLIPPKVSAVEAVIVVSKGESVTLQCKATGAPQPDIIWKRHDEGKKMFDGQKTIAGESITISSVNREHSGSYECVATNSEGTDKARVSLEVQYKPEIEVERTSINSMEGYDAELTCTVHAKPMASVTWIKNNEPVAIDAERIKVMKNGSKHVLSIKSVKSSDFGNYSCIAMNSIGETKADIEVTGRPTMGMLKTSPFIDGVRVQYQIESHDSVDEVKIKYKPVKGIKWEEREANVDESDDAKVIHSGSIILEILNQGEMYEIKIQAKNQFGWSRESDAQKFVAENATAPPGGAQGVTAGTSTVVNSVSTLLLAYFLVCC
ncbi:neural cell adhesion molecule 2-like [Artemia franciscana]|uniref:Ig-like domain-containing protein n=1 Tax=Artemia franciscana TaxID=6661 RepID=A0AA88LHK2_ARTSF|nr:hypothetical protein QYM36_007922 [Artemia franciscana]